MARLSKNWGGFSGQQGRARRFRAAHPGFRAARWRFPRGAPCFPRGALEVSTRRAFENADFVKIAVPL